MKNRYKVLHITPTDISYDSRILKELKALESVPELELTAFGIKDNEGHNYAVTHAKYVVNIRLFTKKMSYLPRPFRYLLNLIEAFIKLTIPAIKIRPDLIHCHDTLYLPLALLVQFFCRSKLIYDAHELESNKAGQSKILSKATLVIERLAWAKIDLLISVSPSIINWYQEKFGPKESLLILNSPLLSSLSNEASINTNYFRDKYNIPVESKIFLYLGIISEEGRGVKKYLEVFKKKDIQSHIVFVGYGEYADTVKLVAQTSNNIHYHAAVPHNKVVEIAKSADIGLCMIEAVSLSDYYCLPNKLFEYAFSGLFVLASDFPDIRSIVDKHGLGKCSNSDIDDIYRGVKELELIERKLNVNNLYTLSWENQEKVLVLKYKELLKFK